MNYSLKSLGMVNCLGMKLDEIKKNLFAGDQRGIIARDDLVPETTVLVGQVPGELATIPNEFKRYDCRNNQILLTAYQQIEADVRAAKEQYGADRLAIILGSSTSGIASAEEALAYKEQHGDWPEDYDYIQQEMSSISEFLSLYTGITGPSYTLSTACSSSGKAFASARNLLDMNICDAVIVGGADSLCKLTLNGFSCLDAISPELSNPMSRNRRGINIGEGAALFLMTKEEGDIQLLGLGESSDAHHISAPQPDGLGAEASMSAALADASLKAEDISYLNLHGTGTPHNDSMESKAVARLFPTSLPCSSTKALTGHTLGASGAIELAFCYLDLQTGKLPPHKWDGELDEDLAKLTLVEKGDRLNKAQYCLSNSFAFGGSNCSLIIGRKE